MRRLNWKFVLGIRLLALTTVVAVLVYLISAAIFPSGRLVIKTDLATPSPYLSEVKPSERLNRDNGLPYRVIGDPLYFDLIPPGQFDTVTVAARYINSGQPLIELGALVDRLDGKFDLRSAENKLIDSLPWSRISSGDFTLLQRHPVYTTVDDFLSAPPKASQVAVYRANINWRYQADDYQPLQEVKTRQLTLRGSHRLLTYTDGEPLSFIFSVQDMNRQTGADPVTISVYREGENKVVARSVLNDDGNTSSDQKTIGLQSVGVSLPDSQSGLYRLEFTTSSDIFIREFTTQQQKFVFLDWLYLGDHVGYSNETPPVMVYTDGRTLTARTPHEEGLQKLTIDNEILEIRELKTRYFLSLAKTQNLTVIQSPRRDVLLETDGCIALDKDDYFDPLPLELTWYSETKDLDDLGINFVLTRYQSPTTDKNSTLVEASFGTSQLATTEDGAYRFVFSTPGIDLTNRDLRLQEITFILQRPPTSWAHGLAVLFSGVKQRISDRITATILSNGRSYGEQVP